MKNTKRLIILALCLVLIGIVISGAGVLAVNFDFSALSLTKFTTTTHTVETDFTKLSISTEISDVALAVSEDDTCSVVCREEENFFHTVSVENHTLTIATQDDRMWYEHIGLHFGNSHAVTVYLPKKAYESLTVSCNTADVEIPKGFSFGFAEIKTTTGDVMWRGSMVNNLAMSVNTGDIFVEDTGCQTLSAKTDTGDICLTATVATQNLTAETDTGDVRFDRFDAKTISVTTDTGDVTGTLLSNKLFITEAGTGDIQVPVPAGDVVEADICRITTKTGDIRISLS